MATATGVRAGSGRLLSHACTLGDLAESLVLTDADRAPPLRLGPGWTRRWTAGFATAQGVVVHPIAELREGVSASTGPVRRFSWRPGQRHRPGLQYLVSTGRHRGFESLAEQRLLLALDFLGVDEVQAQPFELRMSTADGWARHVPDFLACGSDGSWLVDVRPGHRVKPRPDAVCRRGGVGVGAGMAVRGGDRVAAGRDRCGRRALGAASPACRPAGAAAATAATRRQQAGGVPGPGYRTSVPVMARAHALHLIWHRRLGIDLAQPLNDDTLVWAVPPRQDGP